MKLCPARSNFFPYIRSKMKHTKAYLLFLLLSLSFSAVQAQWDNHILDAQDNFQDSTFTSGELRFSLPVLGFGKNNEYFDPVVDGYTLFGYQLWPTLQYKAGPNLFINLGLYLRKDFGNRKYAGNSPMPTFSIQYQQGPQTFIFGTLRGASYHRLIEPLQDFEKSLTDPIEEGIQYLLAKDRLWLDFWVDWENMLYLNQRAQEKITGGVSLEWQLWQHAQWNLMLPVQFKAHHRGGQIDRDPRPLQTMLTGATGLILNRKLKGKWNWASLRIYATADQEVAQTPQAFFHDGRGYYANLGIKQQKLGTFWLSYWYGVEFIPYGGNPIFSSAALAPTKFDGVDQHRRIAMIHYIKNFQLGDQLSLNLRIDPWYNLDEQLFQYAYGFYLVFKPHYKLLNLPLAHEP